ncbi:bifunctional phosphoribosylaminoimidazole carboxylase/phosphoribosylaminoimidazole succinocarboxamide synthetase [Aplochiton taeniatus]
MESGAGTQRRGEEEVVEMDGTERQWGEAEILALMSVWEELRSQYASESRAMFECLSERLRRLSVLRSWRECQAKCRILGLQSRKLDNPSTSTIYSQGMPTRENSQLTSNGGSMDEEWGEEDDHITRDIYTSSIQEGSHGQIHGTLTYAPNFGGEGGRHWSDEEVRALLCVWADRTVRERLRGTLRNKSIFQDMARRMQQNFGVVRNWKQCRTKYKNLKYEYKTAKNTQDAAGNSGGGPGKYMKFFDEVEAIMQDKVQMQRRHGDGDQGASMASTLTRGHGSELVIEIDDDDNGEDYEPENNMEGRWKETEANLSPMDSSSSGQFHVVTVSDTGRNWSDQEVQTLIQVWSEQGMCQQLETSTRKRDIFVQIANRLQQQGVERDWKQCHTKYKNLKCLYRSAQRAKADGTDPRCLMRFYDEVDAIMTGMANRPPLNMGCVEPVETRATLVMGYEGQSELNASLIIASGKTTTMAPVEEKACPTNLFSPQSQHEGTLSSASQISLPFTGKKNNSVLTILLYLFRYN